jgi:RHS repeat-associated protein
MIASDTPILQQNPGTWYYHINDHLGTCRVVTDHQDQVIRAQDYFPFGLTLRSLYNKKTRFSYTGKELDTAGALNWFYFGARFYDPGIGRFLSVDPLAEEYWGSSPYNYSLNNPTKYTDPDGKAVIDYNKGINNYYKTLWDYGENTLLKHGPNYLDAIAIPFDLAGKVSPSSRTIGLGIRLISMELKHKSPYYSSYDIFTDYISIIAYGKNKAIIGIFLDFYMDNYNKIDPNLKMNKSKLKNTKQKPSQTNKIKYKDVESLKNENNNYDNAIIDKYNEDAKPQKSKMK